MPGIDANLVDPVGTTSYSVINVTSTSPSATTYLASTAGTASVVVPQTVSATKATHNNVNQLVGLSAGGAVRFRGATDRPMKSLAVLPANSTFNLNYLTPNSFAYTSSVVGGETMTINTAGSNPTVTLAGSGPTTGDALTLTLSSTTLDGAHSLTYLVKSSDTTFTTLATSLASAVNADSTLQAGGVRATSSGAVVTIFEQPTFTSSVSGAASETVTIATPSNGATTVTIGGAATSGDVLTFTVQDARLAGGQESATYTVGASDDRTRIASGLMAAINADSKLRTIGISSPNDLLLTSSKSFRSNPVLVTGNNDVTTTATSGGGAKTPDTFQTKVIGASSTSFTFDANGNMSSDGSRNFFWDAENRLTKIQYDGTDNNRTDLFYDAPGRCVQIKEVVSSTVTSNLKFVWDGTVRCELRNAASGDALISQYFDLGQRTSGSNYYYTFDHLGSVREMLDASNQLKAEYDFSSTGERSVISETVASDFGYTGMYSHQRSGLNLAMFRVYNPSLGRWLSRDPLGEHGGPSLYSYAAGNPINFTDALGLAPNDNDLAGRFKAWLWEDDYRVNMFSFYFVLAASEFALGRGLLGAAAKAGTKPCGAGLQPMKFYRVMSAEDLAILNRTGRVPATSETFVSPSRSYVNKFNGELVEFDLDPAGYKALKRIGLRDDAGGHPFPEMPRVHKGWTSDSAFFKMEDGAANIGLGQGTALDTFNHNITNFRHLKR